jgi:hypothetical protein
MTGPVPDVSREGWNSLPRKRKEQEIDPAAFEARLPPPLSVQLSQVSMNPDEILSDKIIPPSPTMSERETWRYRFAGMAMQSIISSERWRDTVIKAASKDEIDPLVVVSKASVEYADAMLAELERGHG